MILTCYNTKLAREITSNVHSTNLAFISQDSDLKARMFDNNMNFLQKKAGRKEIKKMV